MRRTKMIPPTINGAFETVDPIPVTEVQSVNRPPPNADGEVGVTGDAAWEAAVATLEADRARRVKEWGERFDALCRELRVHPVVRETRDNGQLVAFQIVPVADP